jgi:hypothetical protein
VANTRLRAVREPYFAKASLRCSLLLSGAAGFGLAGAGPGAPAEAGGT